jgi:hypothetical protein
MHDRRGRSHLANALARGELSRFAEEQAALGRWPR